jgi:hypothetical protein
MSETRYPVGVTNKPWTTQDKTTWLNMQQKKRDYQQLIVAKIKQPNLNLNIEQYGTLNYTLNTYPLYLFKSKTWKVERPTVLITGGVHGYETSGVMGAIAFAQQYSDHYSNDFNFIIAPCISPWGFETINRWNPAAIDPNRSFYVNSPAPESAAIMDYLTLHNINPIAHIDLHETTDTDNSEFRPALAAREGTKNTNWNIPDGFYLVADTLKPQADFQQAVINRVEEVTHIAPSDENNQLIGVTQAQFGVINYAARELGLCMGLTNAPYVTTTEVYPDSPTATPQECVLAQVAAIKGALDYLNNY